MIIVRAWASVSPKNPLVASTGLPMINAIGSSLIAVTAFGMTTAISYPLSGRPPDRCCTCSTLSLVHSETSYDWPPAGQYLD
ncbi:hypothetical protein EOA30_00390 [Mesorhizobium sp. M8A.F.Ca.ET.059.01.1.1]|nr:hypothetical protein EOA30_00390 [Mesorhizobium sp. M8A.F.Ca.ET.059.01.1.1]